MGSAFDFGRLGRQLADLPVEIVYRVRVDSTNQLALGRLREGFSGQFAIVANSQSAGRGRRGASWKTPPGQALALTYAGHFNSATAADLARCGCLALCQALEAVGCREVGIKWPNDVMLAGAKAGGVLIEAAGGGHAIGIGANLNNDPARLTGLTYPAASAAGQLGRTVDRVDVCARLIRRLWHLLADLPAGAADQHQQWVERSTLLGRRIQLAAGGRSYSGTVCQLTAEGKIALEIDGRRTEFAAGTVRQIFAAPPAAFG